MLLVKPQPLDLISFEACFVLSMTSGMYKDAKSLGGLSGVGLDVTVTSTVLLLLATGIRIWRLGVPRAPLRWFALAVYGLLLTDVCISHSLSLPYPFATEMWKRFCVFNTCLFVCPLLAVTKREHVERWLRLLFWFACLASGYAMLNAVGTGVVGSSTAFGGGSNHSLAHLAAFGSVVVVAVVVVASNHVEQPVLLLAGSVMALAILFSSTRQAVVAMFCAVTYILYYLQRSKKSIARLLWAMTAGGVIASVFLVTKSQLSSSVDMTQSVLRIGLLFSQSRTELFETSHRAGLWEMAFSNWKDAPIFGQGFSMFGYYNNVEGYPHNYFFELLAELGLVGFAIGTTLMAIPTRIVLKKPPKGGDWIMCAVGALFVYFSMCMMVSGNITVNRVGFAIWSMVIAYATVANKDGIRSNQPRPQGADLACPTKRGEHMGKSSLRLG